MPTLKRKDSGRGFIIVSRRNGHYITHQLLDQGADLLAARFGNNSLDGMEVDVPTLLELKKLGYAFTERQRRRERQRPPIRPLFDPLPAPPPGAAPAQAAPSRSTVAAASPGESPTTPCPKCGHSIRAKAAHCPHCGTKLRALFPRRHILVGTAIALAVVFAGFGWFAGSVRRARDRASWETERQELVDRASEGEASIKRQKQQLVGVRAELAAARQEVSALRAAGNDGMASQVEDANARAFRAEAEATRLKSEQSVASTAVGRAERAEAEANRLKSERSVALTTALGRAARAEAEVKRLEGALKAAQPTGSTRQEQPAQGDSSLAQGWRQVSDSIAQGQRVTQDQVRQLLGTPASIRDYRSAGSTWGYDGGGSVKFSQEGIAKSITTPRSLH